MNIAESTSQFINGLQNIERAIIERQRESGVQANANNFQWHRGKGVVPPPMAIELEIRVQNKTANAVLSREQVEDSWERINRPDVMAIVKALVADIVRT
jgi:hypothetical protein